MLSMVPSQPLPHCGDPTEAQVHHLVFQMAASIFLHIGPLLCVLVAVSCSLTGSVHRGLVFGPVSVDMVRVSCAFYSYTA